MDVHKLIATLNPDVICEKAVRREVKQILRNAFKINDRLAYYRAAAEARPREANGSSVDQLEAQNPFTLPGFKNPTERHALIFDSMDQSLEALYFWILDRLTVDGWTVSKLLDNFAPSPGSGLFPQMSQLGTRAQEQAHKMLREAHRLIPEILRSAEKLGLLTASGRASEPLSDHDEIQRSSLRSKLETLALYVRWLGPYLKQARLLEQNLQGGPGLVKVFNTAIVHVTLMAERLYPVAEDVNRGGLPRVLLKSKQRNYFSILIVDVKMRSAPERNRGGGFVHRGQIEVVVTSYALNKEEMTTLRKEIERDDFREVIGTVVGDRDKTLSDIVGKIEKLITEPEKKQLEPDDPNPFTALFAFNEDKTGKKERTKNACGQPIPQDSDFEKVIRSQAILDARRRCLQFYEQMKRHLQMAVWDTG